MALNIEVAILTVCFFAVLVAHIFPLTLLTCLKAYREEDIYFLSISHQAKDLPLAASKRLCMWRSARWEVSAYVVREYMEKGHRNDM